ncbi:MAG: hypothetical protein H0X31_24115 [Nostocaceae cyanobacterium]|nr:hypothetical protein [Nostocaceae cyanobacterium]
METQEILRNIPKLSTSDCLKIAEAALEIIQQEKNLTKDEQKRLLAAAAQTAIQYYSAGSPLIAFSEIEGEDFI